MIRRAALIGALLLVVSSCGDSNAEPVFTPTSAAAGTAASSTTAPSSTTTTMAATTTPPTTAAVATTTATTVPAAPLFTIAFDGSSWAFPAVLGNSGDSNGSGCSPPGDALPDGIWFGYAEGVAGGVLTFDLACYFTGAAAIAVSGPDCDTEFGDYCVRNNNPKVFSVPISGAADVFYIDGVTLNLSPVAASAWPVSLSYLPCPGESCGVWLYVNGGSATGIVEMYEE